ncbi:MAG: serine/threonine protein kinase [Isosphaeraceae bacterium]|nr:serine/threonine protein kinase [Isosphaeraceae bacterium]
MGRVYKARQRNLDRIVAIKVLHEALARDPEYLRRFRREAEVAAQLTHPHIVHVFDAGEVDGHPYLVMEYAEGETVQDQLDRGRVFDERTAVAIALAVAEALKHIHRHGLVHRDLKPANIILTRSGAVKLIDLGLARPVADTAWASAEVGNALGTPYYISPEQVRGRVDVDIRSDLYSLGATLYHMVTGRAPYRGTTLEVMRQHVSQRTQPTPPDRLNPRLSGGLIAVIGKLLTKDREQRYHDPGDLIFDLRRLLRGDRPIVAMPEPEISALSGSQGAGEGEGSTRPATA